MRSLLAVTILLAGVASSVPAQNNWVYYGQDQGASKFSTLAQINADNVSTLTRAWTFHTGNPAGFFESTPLVIDGVMYLSAGNAFFALDAITGTQLWKYAANQTTRRGVSYWPGDARTPARIVATAGDQLVALDAKTGVPVPGFGTGGFVEMGSDAPSPPAVYKDLLITAGGKPVIRAWNARTGALVWTFNLIAQPGDPGHETWENDAWKTIGGTNVWGYLSIDAERGIVYAPNSIAGSDYVGVTRPGNNLYGTSLVAIDANSGKLKWFQQFVHHDIWDNDLGAAPTLFDVVKDGKRIPAVAEITKMGLLFMFDRTNGTPIHGIEERPVPQSDVPGEKTSPTQPFPIKPAPLARNSMKKSDLPTGITPEHTAYCQNLWDTYKLQDSGPYTPWGFNRDVVVHPGAVGGGNWNGVTYNAPLDLIITNVMNAGQWGHVEASGTSFRKVTPVGGRFWEPRTRYSCVNPPWGELVAVKASTGDIAWRVPLGIFEELEARGIKTGTPSLGGAISTAGNLVFIGATIDSRFRAFDARTGKELWVDKIEAPAHSIPSTFMGKDGKQYVVVSAGGGGFLGSPRSDVVIAYRLK
ncbi:MAG: PQQ-binding-like beta-propeller repeat protein [Gemmatimonadota bacterium]